MRYPATSAGLVALSCALSLGALSPLATSQDPLVAGEVPEVADATRAARQFANLRISGRDVRRSVARLTRELSWHKSLDAAQREAEETGKPIVWIHALGSLSGYL